MTHYNETVKNYRQSKNFESNKTKASQHVQMKLISLSGDLSAEVLQPRRGWMIYLTCWFGMGDLQTKETIPSKSILSNVGEIKAFSGK